jgi:2-polyprenyl-6-methoxyphenol hydroxylase-like FAD-dependent oxidoreductase
VKTITIIGGGLAGLALGIGLRQRRVPTRIIEALDYPRHRVCGEFISGRGLEFLEKLGLAPLIAPFSRPAWHTAFFNTRRMIGRRRLPSSALCIARFDLDRNLAQRFQELDGELNTHCRFDGSEPGEGIVWATGRRRQASEGGFRWFGLKAHFDRVTLEADLEMHLHRDSYVGLCRLPGGRVNVCGLFRRGRDDNEAMNLADRLRGPAGSLLHARLETAEVDLDSCCSIAGLSLSPALLDEKRVRIGDALTMIPPITGNGMSMAFESAASAVEPLAAYAGGRNDWATATQQIVRTVKSRFSRRLYCARLLHRLMFSRAEGVGASLLFMPGLWRGVFSLTR